ncbi:MAG: AAA family ATPase [Phycisphaerae bacterium]|nr:AAA family ATPase [Phycisphaerae bacterium]
MYLEHWSLELPPFEAQPDSRFLFATEQHEQARAAISYAARDSGEPVLLRGATGCGKTILLRALRRELPREQYNVAFVPEVACSQVGLLRRVAYHLTHALVQDPAAAMDALWRHGMESARNGMMIVLMLDDWPADAGLEMYTELRWLLNLDLEGGRLSVLLSGGNVRPEENWPAWLVQRLFATAEVWPLLPAQVPAYLAHRLRVAAGPPAESDCHQDIFLPEAAALIAEWSGGVPRLINRVAHLSLHAAYLNLAPQVTPEVVRSAIERVAPVQAEPSGVTS